MNYRLLGRTGISVSLLGLGAVKFGRTESLNYPVSAALPSLQSLRELCALAHDLGINLIDTAPAYGVSEARLGELLVGQRHHWLLCTKVGESFDAPRSSYDFSPEHTRHSVMRSLQRLHTSYLDIVLVHSGGDDLDSITQQGTLQMLADLKREGHIRAFGISSKTGACGRLAVNHGDVVMVTLNLRNQDELDVIALAEAEGCGVLIKKPLDSGHAAMDPDQQRRSLEFVAGIAGVSCIVVGTTNPDHLRANAATLTGH